jgi:hypothetical protein
VLGETAQKLRCFQGHLALLVAMRVVSPAEGDLLSIEGQQAVIADGDAMRVPAKIAKNLDWRAEGWLGVYNPLLPKE